MLKHEKIKKSIIKSQHCQRNWDLKKQIPEEDLELLIHAATNCPSKQNVAFYDVHFVTDRNKIEQIHEKTNGFIVDVESNTTTTNSQTLANLVIVFTDRNLEIESKHRNEQIDSLKNNKISVGERESLIRDKHMAIGIAAGYVNIIASILGYGTGCCACFTNDIKDIIGTNNNVELIMGVGFANSNLNRRVHHTKQDFVFPTKKKQKIYTFKHY